jgi:hypothetical protein
MTVMNRGTVGEPAVYDVAFRDAKSFPFTSLIFYRGDFKCFHHHRILDIIVTLFKRFLNAFERINNTVRTSSLSQYRLAPYTRIPVGYICRICLDK